MATATIKANSIRGERSRVDNLDRARQEPVGKLLGVHGLHLQHVWFVQLHTPMVGFR